MLRLAGGLRFFLVLMVGLAALPGPLAAQDALTQTFTAHDGLYTLHYPEGWVAELEPNGLVLANSLASLTQFDDSMFPPPPHTVLLVKLDLLTGLSATRQDLAQPLTPDVVASLLQRAWLEARLVDSSGTVASFTLGQHPTASVALASSQQQAEAIIFVTEIDGYNHVFIAMGSGGELAAYEPVFRAIIASLEVPTVALPPPLPDQTLQIGAVIHASLAQPSGDSWYFDGQDGQSVTIVLVGNFDTMLELYGPDGQLLAQNDDVDISYTSLIENISLPASGVYRVVAKAFSTGSGPYVLVIGLPRPVRAPSDSFVA